VYRTRLSPAPMQRRLPHGLGVTVRALLATLKAFCWHTSVLKSGSSPTNPLQLSRRTRPPLIAHLQARSSGPSPDAT